MKPKLLYSFSAMILLAGFCSFQPASGQVTEGEKHLRNQAITGESGNIKRYWLGWVCHSRFRPNDGFSRIL